MNSKFSPPRRGRPESPIVPEKRIEEVIGRAAADGRKDDLAEEVRFTMTLPAEMAGDVDRARRRAALTRLAWIRLAIAEKLQRDGGMG